MTIKIVIGITIAIVVVGYIVIKFVFIDRSKRDSSSTTNIQIGSKAGGDIVGRDKKTND